MDNPLGQQATMHLNSAVYEIAENEKGEMCPLHKQINNAVPVKAVVMTRFTDASYEDVIGACKRYMQSWTSDFRELTILNIFPAEQYRDRADKLNWTAAYGLMLHFEKADPTQPVPVMDPSPEGIAAARRRALTPTGRLVPFIMLCPETQDYMFSMSLDHVPTTAVHPYQKGQPLQMDDAEAFKGGIDPGMVFISPEDQERFKTINEEMNRQRKVWAMTHKDKPFVIQEQQLLQACGLDNMNQVYRLMALHGQILDADPKVMEFLEGLNAK